MGVIQIQGHRNAADVPGSHFLTASPFGNLSEQIQSHDLVKCLFKQNGFWLTVV